MTITTGTTVTLHNGRTTTVTPRTSNTYTGFVAWLTAAEAKTMKLPGHSTGRYSYSVDMAGTIERWVNGYGSYVAKVQAPIMSLDNPEDKK